MICIYRGGPVNMSEMITPESAHGTHDRKPWSECKVGTHGRNAKSEPMVGTHGWNPWSEHMVGMPYVHNIHVHMEITYCKVFCE